MRANRGVWTLPREVASARQSMEVSAAPSLIVTDTAKIGTTRTARDFNSLPLRTPALNIV
ncbi:MAG: hypothetical protein LC126_20370 [Bryobacterales bacterium]|nr:hypothetical protein [Bryobacterales bacterium]